MEINNNSNDLHSNNISSNNNIEANNENNLTKRDAKSLESSKNNQLILTEPSMSTNKEPIFSRTWNKLMGYAHELRTLGMSNIDFSGLTIIGKSKIEKEFFKLLETMKEQNESAGLIAFFEDNKETLTPANRIFFLESLHELVLKGNDIALQVFGQVLLMDGFLNETELKDFIDTHNRDLIKKRLDALNDLILTVDLKVEKNQSDVENRDQCPKLDISTSFRKYVEAQLNKGTQKDADCAEKMWAYLELGIDHQDIFYAIEVALALEDIQAFSFLTPHLKTFSGAESKKIRDLLYTPAVDKKIKAAIAKGDESLLMACLRFHDEDCDYAETEFPFKVHYYAKEVIIGGHLDFFDFRVWNLNRPICMAIKLGAVAFLRQVAEKHPNLLDEYRLGVEFSFPKEAKEDMRYNTLLDFSFAFGNADVTEFLLNLFKIPNNFDESKYAVEYASVEILEMLHNRGLKFKEVTLKKAISLNRTDCVKWFVENKIEHSEKALVLALLNEKRKMALKIISWDMVDLNYMDPKQGPIQADFNFLVSPQMQDSIQITSNLVGDWEIALEIAISRGYVNIVKALLDKGAAVRIQTLNLALANRQTKILDLLSNSLLRHSGIRLQSKNGLLKPPSPKRKKYYFPHHHYVTRSFKDRLPPKLKTLN